MVVGLNIMNGMLSFFISLIQTGKIMKETRKALSMSVISLIIMTLSASTFSFFVSQRQTKKIIQNMKKI